MKRAHERRDRLMRVRRLADVRPTRGVDCLIHLSSIVAVGALLAGLRGTAGDPGHECELGDASTIDNLSCVQPRTTRATSRRRPVPRSSLPASRPPTGHRHPRRGSPGPRVRRQMRTRQVERGRPFAEPRHRRGLHEAVGQLSCRRPVRRRGRQSAAEDCQNGGGQRRRGGGRCGTSIEMCFYRTAYGHSGQGVAPRQQLRRHQRERVDIPCGCWCLASQLFWSHVERRAANCAVIRQEHRVFTTDAGQAKIAKLASTRRGDEHIGGLDVPMDHASTRCIVECLSDVGYDRKRLACRRACRRSHRLDTWPWHGFHYQHEIGPVGDEVVESDDPRMVETGHHLRFTTQTLGAGRIGAQAPAQPLERDVTVEAALPGKVDHARCPPAELPDQGEVPGGRAVIAWIGRFHIPYSSNIRWHPHRTLRTDGAGASGPPCFHA